MGMKGSWISALKKAFTPKSKKKVHTGQDNNVKEKRLGIARKRHGEVNSFIPLYRETSSIEKILGDVEREEQYTANTPKNAVPDKVKTASSDRKTTVISYKEKSIISSKQAITRSTESITSNHVHISATKIQAVYRGYMGRKRYRTLKGLLRLKNMMKGQSVKRQTMNTMRSMQLLVRIQIQIHSRRLQMMESQNIHQDQISWRSSKEPLSGLSKWNATNQLEGESNDEWDDSMLTKEERAASIKRKVEAVMKRDRALAYAYSHQAYGESRGPLPRRVDVKGRKDVWTSVSQHSTDGTRRMVEELATSKAILEEYAAILQNYEQGVQHFKDWLDQALECDAPVPSKQKMRELRAYCDGMGHLPVPPSSFVNPWDKDFAALEKEVIFLAHRVEQLEEHIARHPGLPSPEDLLPADDSNVL